MLGTTPSKLEVVAKGSKPQRKYKNNIVMNHKTMFQSIMEHSDPSRCM
jgi:hypothetical protein